MKQDDYLKWLISWFKKRVPIPENAASYDFFQAGWIDSLKILELITDIEASFNIRFDDASLSDPRFSTMQGLSEIMLELANSITV